MSVAKPFIFFQGLYSLLTGIWPLVHLKSFIFITGPKTDIWLLQTFSIVLVCFGISCCLASFGHDIKTPSLFLSIAVAAGLMYADIYYSITGVIRPVYLCDAILELIFVAAGLYYGFRKK